MRRSAVRLLPQQHHSRCWAVVRRTTLIPPPPPCGSVGSQPSFPLNSYVSIRTLFGFGKPKLKQSDVPPNIPPGLLEVARMATALDHKLGRPPPPPEIIEAYRNILKYYKKKGQTPVDHSAYALIRALEYLLNTHETLVLKDDLKETLQRIRNGTAEEHVRLAKLAFDTLTRRGELGQEELEAAMAVYSNVGEVKLCTEAMAKWSEAEPLKPQVWQNGIKACLVAGDPVGAQKLWEMMEQAGTPPNPYAFMLFLEYYDGRDDIENLRAWFSKFREFSEEEAPDVKAFNPLFRALARRSKDSEEALNWSKEYLKELENFVVDHAVEERTDRAREGIHVLLQWKGVIDPEEHLDRYVMEVMERAEASRKEAGQLLWPTQDTIVLLVEWFLDQGLLPLAESIGIRWPTKWGIPHSDEIGRVEMRLMMAKKDLVSALRIRDKLSTTPIVQTKEYTRDSKLLLQAVAAEHWVPTELVDRLYEDLEADNVELDPPTVKALSLYLARSRRVVPLIDLLQKFVHVMSRPERISILLALGDLAGHQDTELQDALMIYQVCYQLFPEMTTGMYTDFLRLFLAHGNLDLAVKVFQTMTQSEAAKPDEETYIALLYGIARSDSDLKTVRLVNRAIKVDTEVRKTVQLQNALMAAYASVDFPQYAIDIFWEQWRSDEGPNHETINLALEACRRYQTSTRMSFTISEIWKRLKAHKAYLNEKNYYYMFIAFLQAGNAPQAYNVMMELRSKGFKVTAPMLALLQRSYESDEDWDNVRKWAAKNEWDAYKVWEDDKAGVVQSVEGILDMLWIEPLVEPKMERVEKVSDSRKVLSGRSLYGTDSTSRAPQIPSPDSSS